MLPSGEVFQKSVERQIAINQSRTPSQRFQALCDLLDAARAMAPAGEDALQRRRQAETARQIDREHWRARCRQFLAAQRASAEAGA